MSAIEEIERYILKAAELRHETRRPPISIDLVADIETEFKDCYTDGTPDCVTLPLFTAMAISGEEDWGGLSIFSCVAASRESIRGIPFGRHAVKMWWGGIGKEDHATLRGVSNGGLNWRIYNPNGCDISDEKINDAKLSELPRLAFARQCFVEYLWQVEIQFENNAQSIAVSATQELLEDILSIRDMPSGESKKKRVIHVVTNHRRSTGSEVSKHMRGFMTHAWQGCTLIVKPPVNEVAKLGNTKRQLEIKRAVLKTPALSGVRGGVK